MAFLCLPNCQKIRRNDKIRARWKSNSSSGFTLILAHLRQTFSVPREPSTSAKWFFFPWRWTSAQKIYSLPTQSESFSVEAAAQKFLIPANFRRSSERKKMEIKLRNERYERSRNSSSESQEFDCSSRLSTEVRYRGQRWAGWWWGWCRRRRGVSNVK